MSKRKTTTPVPTVVIGPCKETNCADLVEVMNEVREKELNHMVNRFLSWPLPKSVCSDTCVSDRNYQFPRSGTNLLTADEARQMLEYVMKGYKP